MSYYWEERDAVVPNPPREPGEELVDYMHRLAVHLGYIRAIPALPKPLREREPGEDDE